LSESVRQILTSKT